MDLLCLIFLIQKDYGAKDTIKEIHEACNILLENKYIDIVGKYNNEVRYTITDNYLEQLIVNLFLIINSIRNKIMRIWIYKRKTTSAEKKWLLFFGGIKDLQSDLEQIRKEKRDYKRIQDKRQYLADVNREIIDWDKRISKEFRLLKKSYSIEIDKFHFPYERIRDILYPKIFHGY
jgi:hypothetical protein